jgi:hypothetical protein
MSALVRFVTDAASAETDTFTGRGEKQFAWIEGQTKFEIFLTTEGGIVLVEGKSPASGLKNKLVTAYLKNFRDLPPEQLGVRVKLPCRRTSTSNE